MRQGPPDTRPFHGTGRARSRSNRRARGRGRLHLEDGVVHRLSTGWGKPVHTITGAVVDARAGPLPPTAIMGPRSGSTEPAIISRPARGAASDTPAPGRIRGDGT
ncbi:hypothetical protein GCM10027194_08270 [Thalassiella azotivora]